MYTGIDIGGTNTKVAAINAEGDVLAFETLETQAERPFGDFEQRLDACVQRVWGGLSWDECLAVGVGVPNYSSKVEKLVAAPNLS